MMQRLRNMVFGLTVQEIISLVITSVLIAGVWYSVQAKGNANETATTENRKLINDLKQQHEKDIDKLLEQQDARLKAFIQHQEQMHKELVQDIRELRTIMLRRNRNGTG